MKTKQIDSVKKPHVLIDESLNKYDQVVLFPKKLEKAKRLIEKAGLPEAFKNSDLNARKTH